MFIGRKALQNHLVIIFFFSLVMSVFLIFILKGFYGEEHEFCPNMNFAIENFCKEGTNAKITVANEGGQIYELDLVLNEDPETSYYFAPTERREISVNLRELSTIELTPVIRTLNVNYCRGKAQTIDVGTLTKC